MSRKNNLRQFKNIDAADMAEASIVSAVTCIQWLDNVGIQLNWTGDPTGTFAVEVSADYAQDYLGNVINAGNWNALTLSPTPEAAGEAGSVYIDITQMSAPWLRVKYTNTVLNAASVTLAPDVAGSLNSKYFLIDTDTTDYYVWYNINSAGVNPAIPNRTGIAVAGATGATAATLATATRAALAAATAIDDIAGGTGVVTFTQATPGPDFLVADGAAPTGFTITSESAGAGTLNGYITGKMI